MDKTITELINKWEKELERINKKQRNTPIYYTESMYFDGKTDVIENFLQDLKQLEESNGKGKLNEHR